MWRGLGRILAAVAVVLWAASTGLPRAEATPPGEEGRVTFGGDETSSGLDEEIYSANSDGTGFTPLTANDVDDSMPVWSPDGERIAFRRQGADTNEIWVMNADGSNQRLLLRTELDVVAHSWSPNGRRMTYLVSDDGVYLASQAMGGGGGSVTFKGDLGDHFEEGRSLEWSPDGTRLLVIGERDGVAWVATTDLDGADVRLLRTAEEARWLPNGLEMVLRVSSQEARGMGIMNSDGSEFRYLFYTDIGSGAGYFPAPSPEGHRVAFAVPLLNRVLAIDVSGSSGEALFSWTGGTPLDISWQRVLPPSGFVDVGRGHTFESEVAWLAAEGITNGCSALRLDIYCPDESVTRAQMASFLVRALADVEPSPSNRFADDDESEHEPEINGIADARITGGCNPSDPSLFCPDDPVTRAQMASFLYRALDLPDAPTDTFTDDDGSVHEPAIESIAAAGITLGCDPADVSLFCPGKAVTRAQMAGMLSRALGGD